MEIIIRAVDQASTTIKGIGQSGLTMSKDMEASFIKVGAAMTGVGIACKLMADNINNSFVSFEKSIAVVKSLGTATDDEMARIEAKAIELSKVMPMSAEEIAGGFYQMMSAGYSAGDAIEAIDTIARMAVGGQLEMGDAVNAVTMVMDVYGEKAGDAEHITDVLMGTVSAFKTTLPQLQQELSKSIAPASALGISFEEVAAMAGMLKKDFVSAEEAGTALKTMFVRLSDENVIKYLNDLGVNVADANGNFVGMESILSQLDTALQASGGNLDRNATLIKIFGTEGFRAADSLLRQKDKMGGYVGALEAGGKATEAFNAIMETTASKLDIAENKMTAAKIALGTAMAPATILAADAMSTFAGIIEKLPGPLQGIIGSFLIFGQALIPLGPLMMALPTLIGAAGTAFGILGGALTTGTIAIAGTTIALGTLIVPILAVIAAAVLLYAAWKTNFMGIRDVVGSAKEFISDRLKGIRTAMEPVVDALKAGFGKIKDAAGELFGKIDEVFKKFTGGASIMKVLSAAFDAFGRIVDYVWKIIGSYLVKAIDMAVAAITVLIEFIGKVVEWFDKLTDHPVIAGLIKLAGVVADTGAKFFDALIPPLEKTAEKMDETAKAADKLGAEVDTAGKESGSAMTAFAEETGSAAGSIEGSMEGISGAAGEMANAVQGACSQATAALNAAAASQAHAQKYASSASYREGMGLEPTGFGEQPNRNAPLPAVNPSTGYNSPHGTRGPASKVTTTAGSFYIWQDGGYSTTIAGSDWKSGNPPGDAGREDYVPLMARGGNISEGGSAIVGDAGAELLNLPKGAKVTPLTGKPDLIDYERLADAVGSRGGVRDVHLHIQNLIGVPDKASLRPITRVIKNLLDEEQNRRGVGA